MEVLYFNNFYPMLTKVHPYYILDSVHK